MKEIGLKLKNKREENGVTKEEAASDLKVETTQIESIKRYNQGQALFVCGNKRMQIDVIVTQDELDSFGTGGGL